MTKRNKIYENGTNKVFKSILYYYLYEMLL